EQEIAHEQGRAERHGDALLLHVAAEEAGCAEQEQASEPGRGDHRRADDPARPAGSPARQSTNTDIEADPGQRRGYRLDDGLNENEEHCCLLSPNRFPTSATVCDIKSCFKTDETYCCAPAPINAFSGINGPTGMYW